MFIEKASATVAYGGGGAAVFFGLTTSEWQVVGVIGGLVIGAIGLLVNVAFKFMHYRLTQRTLEGSDDV